jgi:hypothetical protein
MRLPLALTAAALAVAFAAAPAQAGTSAPAQGFTPPIGTDKGSVVAPPTTPHGIIAVLIG